MIGVGAAPGGVSPAWSSERGQALVELVASLPAIALVGLMLMQALAAGAAHVYADHAVHAAVVAGQLGRDEKQAAREAVPGWSSGRVYVSSAPSRVVVSVRPRSLLPPLARLMTARAVAYRGMPVAVSGPARSGVGEPAGRMGS